MLMTTTKLCKEVGRLDPYIRLRDATAADRGWSDAYMYALVATGRADIAIDPIMNIWDTAAPFVCVNEAGGRMTTWDNQFTHAGVDALATNGRLHEAAVETLSIS
jgi:fructose-1,6-bisphosphatase/inositol monophosphatase family enzyme